MSRILVLSNHGMAEPTGLPALVRRILGPLLSNGHVVVLALCKRECGLPLFESAEESYATDSTCLQVQWWPGREFQPNFRQEFVYRIERLHAEQPLSHIVALDVRSTGFAATVASRLIDVPVSVLVTHRDAFQAHFLAPQELDVVAEHARYLLSANPAVLDQLAAFYDVAPKLMLLDSRPDEVEMNVWTHRDEQAAPIAGERDRPYAITTGTLNERIHVGDLLRRVESVLTRESFNWMHVGVCEPTTLLTVHQHLVSRGMQERFQITGVLSCGRYVQIVRGAQRHIVPQGERNTNIGVYESQAWGIPTDTPSGFPFPSSPIQHTTESRLGAYDLRSVTDFQRLLFS